MPTVSMKIQASPDDGSMVMGAPYNNTVMLDLGAVFDMTGTPDPHDTWLRFRGVNIPKGAAITSAIIRFMAAQNQSRTPVNLRVQAEASDNPTAPLYDYYNRTRTAALVDWNNVAAWLTGVWYESPNIAAVIQEIVNRTGWVEGNAILLFVQNNESGPATDVQLVRRAWTYDQDPTYAAELIVTYEVAPTTCTVQGNVTDEVSGLPIEGATVTCNGLNRVTGSGGFYQFADIPIPGSGIYILTASAVGYTDASETINVSAGGTLTQDFKLTPEAPPPAKGTLEVHAYQV